MAKAIMTPERFIYSARDLEAAGLKSHPEIGDVVAEREGRSPLAILVDPKGMALEDLRASFVWLPTVEQSLTQFEARQAILFHAGLEMTEVEVCYKTIIQAANRQIETRAESFCLSLGVALRGLLMANSSKIINWV